MKKSLIFLFISFAMCTFSAAQEMRIISLMPSATEILFAVNAKTVVAAGSFCNYPKEVISLEKVGDYYSPDIERIVFLKPDLVITQKSSVDATLSRLKKLNINILALESEKNIEDIYKNIMIIGVAVNASKNAEALVVKMKKAFKEVQEKSPKQEVRPKVFIHVDTPYWTSGKNSYLNSLVELAGGQNLFAGEDKDFFNASWEAVVAGAPDIILNLTPMNVDYDGMPAAASIPAIKNKRIIYPADKDIIVRPSPRAVDGAKYLNSQFFK